MEQVGIKAIGRTAFDAVYERNAQIVYQTALYYSGNHHTAEEIMQAVFMKLYVNMENIKMESVDSWLLVTAKHMTLNENRKSKHEILKDEVFDSETGSRRDNPEDCFMDKLRRRERRELADSIFESLYRINERWYDAILLTCFLGKPHKEVAEIMGMSVDSLNSMLHRARRWIRRNYEEEYDHLNKA